MKLSSIYPALLLATPVSAQSLFGPPVLHPASPGTTLLDIDVGDLNEDGNLDVVAACRNGGEDYFIYFGDGLGGLSAPVGDDYYDNTRRLALADLDGDGHLDIAQAAGNPASLGVRLGDGTGAFSLPILTQLSGGCCTTDLALADFDGDGDIDALVCDWSAHQLVALSNDGAANFSVAHTLPVPYGPVETRFCDMNLDGLLDVVATCNDYGTGDVVSVFLSTGSGFGARSDFPVSTCCTENFDVADVNLDGFPDVVVSVVTSGPMGAPEVLLGDGSGGLSAPLPIPAPSWATPVTDVDLLDLDMDGVPELVMPEWGTGIVRIFVLTPGSLPVFQGDYATLGGNEWGGSGIADLDKDGRPELIQSHYQAGAISVLPATWADCDANGSADVLELTASPWLDCDGNGLLDPCELLATPSLDQNGNGTLDVCDGLVVSYCPNSANSSGTPAVLDLSGSLSVSNNTFTLQVAGAVPNQFGMLFYGPSRNQTLYGNGMVCITQPYYRLQPAVLSDAAGHVSRHLDFTQIPASSGPGQITSLSTWDFQYWYRDPNGTPTSFNFSSALEVTFTP
ncbi:MAG: VCBS repeat-containing protein [Planctomycetes bacterium]|nr:VCBS repeat-containing protein [Planctomycetota bacterium]